MQCKDLGAETELILDVHGIILLASVKLGKVGTISDLGGKMVGSAEAFGELQKSVNVGIGKVGTNCWRGQEGSGKTMC